MAVITKIIEQLLQGFDYLLCNMNFVVALVNTNIFLYFSVFGTNRYTACNKKRISKQKRTTNVNLFLNCYNVASAVSC